MRPRPEPDDKHAITASVEQQQQQQLCATVQPPLRFGVIRPPHPSRFIHHGRRSGINTTPFEDVSSSVQVIRPGLVYKELESRITPDGVPRADEVPLQVVVGVRRARCSHVSSLTEKTAYWVRNASLDPAADESQHPSFLPSNCINDLFGPGRGPSIFPMSITSQLHYVLRHFNLNIYVVKPGSCFFGTSDLLGGNEPTETA
ncbi:uncharacterized protein BT62DRAFT_1077802 [Guyanagaster necrorhizus]|uniref:Uncharacterized protein n=1 Tax=Guyanagaster necrorhizus TaxID=856835 RepID=A0A9P7VPG5_9AGAR|nr:uncharacterized protein BT62DRAFT_1077802 [Guyanagaster necrorhizus MCA 3950]KAG7444474.1 hypothetical protein BT62DRAFT_1077802 [Guyanagaster necrorhizus MCA 3950]